MSHICLPPLENDVAELLKHAQSDVWIVSPWIKYDALRCIPEFVLKQCNLKVISAATLRDFLEETSDIDAFQKLVDRGAHVRLINNLHAKVYVVDSKHAIITSANLTNAGLRANIEIGVYIADDQVEAVVTELGNWFAKAKPIDSQWLNQMRTLIKEKQNAFTRASKQSQNATRCGYSLLGPRIPVVRPVANHTHQCLEEYDWRKAIMETHRLKANEELARNIVRFFERVFMHLDDKSLEAAYFGVHNNCVSVTIGNIWIASVSFRSKHVYLLTEDTYYWSGEQISISATRRYSLLKWILTENMNPLPILETPTAWISFCRAQKSVWESPISKLIIQKNNRNKIRVQELISSV